jgi:arylsulfatase A-like enzyme
LWWLPRSAATRAASGSERLNHNSPATVDTVHSGRDDRPNIVMIIADDHGREAVGCYGNPVVSTPNIDRLAERGVRFDNAFCTTASCGGSRSVILTGLHTHTNRTFGLVHQPHNFSTSLDVHTLPSLMRQAGYRTGRMGKKHYQPESHFPFDFDPPEWGTDEDLARHCVVQSRASTTVWNVRDENACQAFPEFCLQVANAACARR